MAFDKEEATRRGKINYRAGVGRIGESYKTCAKVGGMGTAACLHAAKLEATYDFDEWANRWATAMAKA